MAQPPTDQAAGSHHLSAGSSPKPLSPCQAQPLWPSWPSVSSGCWQSQRTGTLAPVPLLQPTGSSFSTPAMAAVTPELPLLWHLAWGRGPALPRGFSLQSQLCPATRALNANPFPSLSPSGIWEIPPPA